LLSKDKRGGMGSVSGRLVLFVRVGGYGMTIIKPVFIKENQLRAKVVVLANAVADFIVVPEQLIGG